MACFLMGYFELCFVVRGPQLLVVNWKTSEIGRGNLYFLRSAPLERRRNQNQPCRLICRTLLRSRDEGEMRDEYILQAVFIS